MKSLYLVTISAKLDRGQVIGYLCSLKGVGTWFYSMPGSFFIYSSLSALQISEAIANRFGANERRFVVRVTGSEYYGWMPTDHWRIVNDQGAEKRYNLKFNGYYLSSADLPSHSGIYCVYKCRYDKATNRVTLIKLLYIGQSDNIYRRHSNHENRGEWERWLSDGEQLCFTYADVPVADLQRCEAAMIFSNQPVCNHTGKDSFPFFDTYLAKVGATILLKEDGVVEQTK